MLINAHAAFPHPILLNLNEMKCPRSPLYNDTKFTLISVQIRPQSYQYKRVQGPETGLTVFRPSHSYFTGNCIISREGNSLFFFYFDALLKAYNTRLSTNIYLHYLWRYTEGNSSLPTSKS